MNATDQPGAFVRDPQTGELHRDGSEAAQRLLAPPITEAAPQAAAPKTTRKTPRKRHKKKT